MKDTYKPRWQLRYTYRLIQIDGWIDRWIDPYIDPYIHRMDRQNCKIVRRICKTWVHSGCSYTLLAAKICANSISFAVNIGKYPVNRLDQWSYRFSRHRVRSNGDISEIQTIPHKDNYCAKSIIEKGECCNRSLSNIPISPIDFLTILQGKTSLISLVLFSTGKIIPFQSALRMFPSKAEKSPQ